MLKKKFQALLVITILIQAAALHASDGGEGNPGAEPGVPGDFNPTQPEPKEEPLPLPPSPPCAPKPPKPCAAPLPPPAPPQSTQVTMTPGEVAVMICFDRSLRNPVTGAPYCTVTDSQRIGKIQAVDDIRHPRWARVNWEGQGQEDVAVDSLYPEVDTRFHDLNRKYSFLDPRNIPVLHELIDQGFLVDEVSFLAPDGIYRGGKVFSVFYDGTVEYTSELHNPEYYRFRDYAITHVNSVGRRVMQRGEWREGDIVEFHDGGVGQTRIEKLYWNNTALIRRYFENGSSNSESVKSLDSASSPNRGGYEFRSSGYSQSYGPQQRPMVYRNFR